MENGNLYTPAPLECNLDSLASECLFLCVRRENKVVWVVCDDSDCHKWRMLPKGTKLTKKQKYFCGMKKAKEKKVRDMTLLIVYCAKDTTLTTARTKITMCDMLIFVCMCVCHSFVMN